MDAIEVLKTRRSVRSHSSSLSPALMPACGGGSVGRVCPPATTAGTYTVTVTGTSGSTTATGTVTLTVL